MDQKKFKIAAIQASPVFMDREATLEKTCKLIADAGHDGAQLAVFPEAFIPTYPDWIWNVPPGQISLNQKHSTLQLIRPLQDHLTYHTILPTLYDPCYHIYRI